MKQSLQLRIRQHLTMTPQLQQAIRLLQLSTLDLQQEIQQVLESNMMLEIDDDNESLLEPEYAPEVSTRHEEIGSEGSQTDIPDELPVDTTWEDVYGNVFAAAPSEMQEFEVQRSNIQTLQDHLLWQRELTPFSERDYAIATAIIDAINDDGYLSTSLEDIHQGLLDQIDALDPEEVEAVLHRVQNFDPPGVAAVDIADCLAIQLRQMPDGTPWKQEALELVKEHLELLAAQDRTKLERKLELTEESLNQVIALIRSLNPRPGSRIRSEVSQYVIPDVFVFKKSGKWQAALNPDVAPKLRINPFYSGMIKRADNSEDNACMRNHLQEARWFLKSLQSRSDTLLKVARCIVERQKGFLEHGPIAMKPMVLRDIAEEVEMHESTISRVTTQKYMHTPNGIFEFKYFFSSHVSTAGGGECSATAIRALIKQLIENENPAKPLSDSKLLAIFQERGINVARRTIAKYREAMSISSSSQRKRIL